MLTFINIRKLLNNKNVTTQKRGSLNDFCNPLFLKTHWKIMKKLSSITTALIALFIFLFAGTLFSQDIYFSEFDNFSEEYNISRIKTPNGKFYAYVVLLFNENPHFVNIIQKDSIPSRLIGNEGFHIRKYKQYMEDLTDPAIRNLAERMFEIYIEPYNITDEQLVKIEEQLLSRNVVLKFSRDRVTGSGRVILDYCIFGRKKTIDITHPLLHTTGKIYNIDPLIYYDEFYTSNSTFYYDMIYINPGEVNNDYLIARRVLSDRNVSSMFFVGARVTEDIKNCLKKAFHGKTEIREEIFRMFVIHELTHKITYNRYDNFDQATGEELAMASTIYANPYLGLAVMYAYLNYSSSNPHRIAAINFLKYLSEKSGGIDYLSNPDKVKDLREEEIKKHAKGSFEFNISRISR